MGRAMATVSGNRVAAMDNLSAGEVGGVLAGAIAVLAALGKGLQWLFNWQGAREDSERARLQKWEEALDRRDKEQREQTDKRLHAMEKKVGVMSMALFEAIGELQRLDPASGVLVRARSVLQELYPADPKIPEEIKALVRRVDGDIT